MSFFQNPFSREFRGNLVLSDRHQSLTFVVPPNRNLDDTMAAWNAENYDMSTHNALTINYAFEGVNDFKNFSALTINVAGSTAAATTATDVVTNLNNNATFAALFTANVHVLSKQTNTKTVMIKTKRTMHVYISNTSAERVLRFNKRAGVAELPTYFARHTVANRFNFTDSVGQLIELDEGDSVDQNIITDAGFDYSAMQADWQLLAGRSGLFIFKKYTYDGDGNVTSILEYQAGAKAGDLARKIDYSYDEEVTDPSQITEIPYVLEDADLITPP